MLAHREPRRFTREEYLALEEHADTKSEYHQGSIYAMTGASVEHNQLVRNLAVEMGGALKGGPCQLFLADMRLYVAAHDLFTYPDLFVVCGAPPRMGGRRDTLTDATLVVEVLSPSTELYDRGEKFLFYQTLDSLREYVLVSQSGVLVERHTLTQPGQWVSTRFEAGAVELASVGIEIVLEEIYDGVELTR